MVYPPELLDRLQAITPAPWSGRAFRHMFADYPPDAENTRGARWNPAGVAAIYTSLARAGALAEAAHQIAMQPIPPRGRRTLYTLELSLASVLDLANNELLQDLGIGPTELTANDMVACRQLGGAAHWLERDGLLLPSARSPSTNLVIFPAKRPTEARFEIISAEAVESQH
ncbi:MAG: RES family NAD+ phosphorylase [Solirubrobacteraceae bacterium]